jgi:hypothetical protein
MIIIYPLLVDETISASILPGLCKTLEKYTLIFKLDEVLKLGGLPMDSRIISWARDAAADLSIAGGAPYMAPYIRDQYEIVKNSILKEYKNISSVSEAKNGFERERELPERKISTVIPRNNFTDNISIEPTWCQTQSRRGAAIVGVKVVPYPINSKLFIEQIKKDKAMSFKNKLYAKFDRIVTRAMFAIERKLNVLNIEREPGLTGRPMQDIIYATTHYGTNTYLILNYANLSDDSLFRDSGGMSWLFALGWNSIMVADDVMKRCIFCMKEYKGSCTVVPYAYIYASLGQQAYKVYGDMEDLKKSASPFFSGPKLNASSYFGENYYQEVLQRYSLLASPCLTGDCQDER